MQMLFFLVVILAAMVSLDYSGQVYGELQADRGNTLASEMIWYHNQAFNQCGTPSSCGAGKIAVNTSALGPLKNGQLKYASQFASYTDGQHMVVTVWAPPANTPFPAAGVGAALRRDTLNSRFAGVWNASTQTITSGADYLSNGQVVSMPAISVPQGFAGAHFTDGEPMLVNQID